VGERADPGGAPSDETQGRGSADLQEGTATETQAGNRESHGRDQKAGHRLAGEEARQQLAAIHVGAAVVEAAEIQGEADEEHDKHQAGNQRPLGDPGPREPRDMERSHKHG
jgi:hypothetical protein